MTSMYYQSTIDALPYGLVRLDSDNHIILWNRMMDTWTGRPFESVQGKKLPELFSDVPNLAGILSAVRQSGRNCPLEHTGHPWLIPIVLPKNHGSGLSEMVQECRLTPVEKSAGHVVISIVDVTPQDDPRTLELNPSPLMSQAIDKSRKQFADFFDMSPDALIMTNELGMIKLANRKVEEVFGWKREELIGQPIEILMPEEFREDHAVMRKRFFQNPEARTMAGRVSNLRALRKDGNVFSVEISLSPLRTEAGTEVIAAVRDVTERKNFERHVLRSQRLESLGCMAGGVAHDLNNTFQPILMILEMLRSEHPESITEFLEIAEDSTRRGAEMVHQLLTFAKGSKGENLLIDPKHLLHEVEKVIKNTFPKSIRLKTRYAEESGAIRGDVTLLNQVMLNLCANARDAMPDGGTLSLELEEIVCDETFVRFVADANPGTYARIRVTDTGKGISSEIIDHIFEPFFTTKSPDKGTGLGLSAAMGIVKGQGGFLRVESKGDQGSRFEVYLPKADAAMDEENPSERTEFQGNGELFLVVDDETAICEMLKAALERLGFRVITASDGSEALIHIGKHEDKIKFLLTDINMPVVDGLVLARAVRQMVPEARVIAMTGVGDENKATQLRDLGVDGLILKPFNTKKLIQALDGKFTRT